MSDNVTYSICEKCSGLNRVPFSFPDGKSPICGKCKSSLPLLEGVSNLTPSSLNTLSQKSPLPVVVDFWAPWCGPCRSFTPTFTEAASRFKGRIAFGKIDTQMHPGAGETFAVKGIPTLMVFYHGKEIDRVSGALPIEEFVTWLIQTTSTLV